MPKVLDFKCLLTPERQGSKILASHLALAFRFRDSNLGG